MVSFSLPPITDNPDGSWGPSSSNMPPEYKFREIPYAPYSKSDKLGRFADWYEGVGDSRNPAAGLSTTQGTRSGPARGRKDGTQAFGSGTASAFAYFHVEDESSFSLVDSKATAIRRGSGIIRGRTQGRGTSTYNRGRGGGSNRGGGFQSRGGGGRGARRGWRDWEKVFRLCLARSGLPRLTRVHLGRAVALVNPLLLLTLHGPCWKKLKPFGYRSCVWKSTNQRICECKSPSDPLRC